MLSEIIFASVVNARKLPQKQVREPGLSCSGLFPCAYRLYLSHKGKYWDDTDLSPVTILNLADGWDQEEQTVRRLAEAGIVVETRGWEAGEVVVGRSKMKGHVDGTVVVKGVRKIWEHKAFNYDNFINLKQKGIEAFPNYKCQVQAYMMGKGLESCIFMAKHKESNDLYDIEIPYDRAFIEPIIEWADKIRMENWKPKPEESDYCTHCRVGCFGLVLNFGKITSASAPEAVEKWKQGKLFQQMGKALEEEARGILIGVKDKRGEMIQKGLIGDRDLLLVEDLKVTKNIQRRLYLNSAKLVELYGPDALFQVGEEKEVITYMIRQTKQKENMNDTKEESTSDEKTED